MAKVASSEKELLSHKEVCRKLGVSRSTLFKWISQGIWPEPIRVTPRFTRWTIQTVEEAMRNLDRYRRPA